MNWRMQYHSTNLQTACYATMREKSAYEPFKCYSVPATIFTDGIDTNVSVGLDSIFALYTEELSRENMLQIKQE